MSTPVEHSIATEQSAVGVTMSPHQPVAWKAQWRVDKYAAHEDDVRAGVFVRSTNDSLGRLGAKVEPYETIEREGNLLTYGGADVLWLGLRTGLSATTGLANTLFNNANATIKVGNSNTAAAATQTELQAAGANRAFSSMEATFPTHTTGTGASTSSKILFKSVFGTAAANFAWEEWGIFNRRITTGGRMLNRKVESLGTKTSAATWTFTCTISLA